MVKRGMKLTKNSDSTNATSFRSQSKPNDKGKEPIRSFSPFRSDTSHYNGSTLYPSYDSSRPSSVEGFSNGRSKLRGGLVAASDALNFKFGRRKPSIRQHPRPIILPGVLEISAPPQDEEVEERNRLREMAAQAIGLGPFMVSQGSEFRDESTTDEDVERLPASDNNEIRRLGYSESTPNIVTRSPHESSFSETMPAQPSSAGRFRSGSMLAHSPTTTTAMTSIPSFPSTLSALTSFRQSDGVYPKYYPPSSLRIFALSKNWKSRFLVLSSPATPVTRGQNLAVSYLHLFKSSSPEERELERLEINADSVVFVAEEEVGGRRPVIKVGGADAGVIKKEYIHEEGGYTMWHFQITGQAEAQQWITNIKNAIFGQRSVRAGLTSAHTLGKNEPRGDMDVMLSIRAQAVVTSPTPKPRSTHSSTSPQNTSQDRHYASSISSHSATSQRTSPKAAGANRPVSALKGLFTTSTRSRSGSRAASVDFERQQERGGNDESFTSMRSLLGILRPNSADMHTVSAPAARTTSLPLSGRVDPIDRRIDRKILTEQQPIQWATADQPPVNRDRANRTLSLGALSLQPPPRKRRTAARPISEFGSPDFSGIDKQPNVIAVQVSDLSVPGSRSSVDRAETELPSTPNQLSAFHFGTPEKSRALSLRSVSTVNSGDHALSIERSSSSTKRSSGPRRWSKQGNLPNRLTPPSEPPPAIPGNHSTLCLHPYAAERAPSPTPSRNSQQSVVSTLPSFSKRASGSSARSVNSYDAARSHSIATGASSSTNGAISIRSTASHRSSMPPPRPPPTAALPPAPVQEPQDTPTPSEAILPPSKSSFRNSVAQRAFRLSTTAPKPPPSTNLPPRPDEPELKTHRRSSSQGQSIKLESIPASPIPPSKSISPFPPPVGPLPPTPSTLLPSPELPPAKQPSSIKQRLRMLSAPLPSAGQSQNIANRFQRLSANAASPLFTTSPGTPIAEKITLFQNDPSFLQMHTPTLPSQSLDMSLFPPPSEESAGITSLSPPPRRGSKQLPEMELESPKRIAVPDETLLTVGEEPRHLSLSRPVSIMSINISPYWQANETDSDSSPSGVTPIDELLEEAPEEVSEEKSTLEPRHLSLSRPGSVISLGIMAL
ncbi:hypothetical protein BYT27DRAFT_6876795 [Phlegmacium glaucopus]|nr:hypothetical protein BYT27DRAFT_6876795 [Phlegmacium glaucopus]